MSDCGPSHDDGPLVSPALRHERADVKLGGLLLAASILAATVVLGFMAASCAFHYLNARAKQSEASAFPLAAEERGRLPPEPRLEGIDRQERNGHEPGAVQQRLLETYGWVDEKAGIVRIPLSRAMKTIVDHKLLPAQPDDVRGRKPEGEGPRPSAANSGRAFGRERR